MWISLGVKMRSREAPAASSVQAIEQNSPANREANILAIHSPTPARVLCSLGESISHFPAQLPPKSNNSQTLFEGEPSEFRFS